MPGKKKTPSIDKWAPPEVLAPEGLSENELFDWAMQDVDPLPQQEEILFEKQPIGSNRVRNVDQEALQALDSLVKGELPFDLTFSEEYIESAAVPAARPLLRRLRRGDFTVQDSLDLHGMDREEARRRVELFIHQAVIRRQGCVKIIHGRGHNSKENRAILKQLLQHWLATRRMSRNVLAYSSARPCDGGFGAIYVLLRKK